jgi:choline-sulfatase
VKLTLILAFAGLTFAQTPVILISVDTLRGDRLGNAPNISSWAAQGGTKFTAAETQIPLTLPSHTVLLTSRYPYETRVEGNTVAVPKGITSLATVLRSRGYKTGAFIGSVFLEREFGLDPGFDTYDSPFTAGAFSRLSGEILNAARERRPGALVIRAANQWLAQHRNEPAFAFIHLFDVHKPWQAASYDAQVTATDRLLGSLQQTLQKEGWWDRALVIVTADHGEGLGDHGESDHGYFIYESTVHVPLIIHWPQGGRKMASTISQPVGLIDVAPSILEYLNIPVPRTFRGQSFLNNSARSVFSESVYARDSFGWAPLRSLRAGDWKYIDAPKPELYNLATDPGERRNVIASNPAEAASLKAQLSRYAAAPVPVQQTSGDPRQKKEVLESLGYIAPGPRGTGKGPAADPKDRLPVLLRYEEALGMMAAKRYEAAIAALRGILAVDPGNLLARRDLGVALIERKEFKKAIPELQRVAAAAPEDYITRYELGIANEQTGQLRTAADQFETALRLAPSAAQAKEAVERIKQKLSGR